MEDKMDRGGFSWKRAIGITKARQNLSRQIGIPLTKSGRQRKIGSMMTGNGCLVLIFSSGIIPLFFFVY
jgi:hypothetical protein